MRLSIKRGVTRAVCLLRNLCYVASCTGIFLIGCGGGNGDTPGIVDSLPEKLEGHLALLSGPKGVALEPEGRTVLVTELESGELSRVNLSSGRVTTLASGLVSPSQVVRDPVEEIAYVIQSCHSEPRISRVDLKTGEIKDLIKISKGCFSGLAMDTSNSLLAGERDEGRIVRVDTLDGGLETILSDSVLGGIRGLGIENAENILAVIEPASSGSGNVYRINLKEKEVAKLLANDDPNISRPYGISLASGNSALITAEFTGILAVLPNLSSSSSLTPLFKNLNGPTGFVIEEDGTVLVAESATNDLTLIVPNKCTSPPCSAPEPQVPGLRVPVYLLLEEGGETALVSEQNPSLPQGGELSRVDVRTGQVETLISGLSAPEDFLRIGNLVYVLEKIAAGNIKEIDLQTGKILRTVNQQPLMFPTGAILENNESILVTERGGGRISRVNLNTGAVTYLAESLRAPSSIVLEPGVPNSAIVAEIGTKMDGSDGQLSRVDLVSGKVSLISEGFDFPLGLSFLDNETLLVVEHGGGGSLSKIRIVGPQIPTSNSIIAKEVIAGNLGQPQRVAIEPGNQTALVTEINPDGIRRVKIQ